MGTNTLSLTAVTTAQNNRKYRVIVSNAYGSVTSDVCTLTVNSGSLPPSTAPSIVTQPSAQSISQNANATFSITASGDAPLSYQWEYSTDNGATWTNVT